jgi:hypothetical protein
MAGYAETTVAMEKAGVVLVTSLVPGISTLAIVQEEKGPSAAA